MKNIQGKPTCWLCFLVDRIDQWRIQDFPEEGVPTPGVGGGGHQHTILPNFPKNCIKFKEFGIRIWNPSFPLDPPLGARLSQMKSLDRVLLTTDFFVREKTFRENPYVVCVFFLTLSTATGFCVMSANHSILITFSDLHI